MPGFFRRKPRRPVPSAPPLAAKPPGTLGECHERKLRLEVFCQVCYRRKHIDPAQLIPRFGADYRLPNLNGKLKCSLCSSSSCQVAIATTASDELIRLP